MNKEKAAASVVVLTYGPSGVGKTTDMGYSFPRALFLAAPGALNSIESVCGYTPERAFVATIQQATEVIEKVGEKGRYRTVVIDDFSFMAQQTFSELEAKYANSRNPFKLWGSMRDIALGFRDKSRYAGVNVILNCWEQVPKNKSDGTRVRGGPELSGKLPESIPALCDVVLRAVHEPRSPHKHKAAYRCSSDPNFVMKDRFNIAPLCDPCPMNLAELLRASGMHLPRHSEIEGQEEQVEAVAKTLTGDLVSDTPRINEVYAALIGAGNDPRHVRWTIRDAVDRAVIRADLTAHSLSFFDAKSSTLLG